MMYTVSIIVPFRIGERILISVDAKDWPDDVEIIPVSRGKTPGEARNIGAKLAHAPILVFIDDDCSPQVGWLHWISKVGKGEMIGGRTLTSPSTLKLRLIEAIGGLGTPDNGDYLMRMEVEMLSSANMAVDKKAFLKIGGFNESMATGEDIDLCKRWHGLKYYEPRAVVAHYHYGSLLRRAYVSGKQFAILGYDREKICLRMGVLWLLAAFAMASVFYPILLLATLPLYTCMVIRFIRGGYKLESLIFPFIYAAYLLTEGIGGFVGNYKRMLKA